MRRRPVDGLAMARAMLAPIEPITRDRTHVFTYGGETTLAKVIYRKPDGSKTVAPFRPMPEDTIVERLPVFGLKAGWHRVDTRWGRRCWTRLDVRGFDDPHTWPDEPAVWIPGWRPHLYRVDDMVMALAEKPDRFVCFPEGEKDADTLFDLGLVAVASYWGASVEPSDIELAVLRDCHVVILADNDEPGRRRASRLAPRLREICASVRTVTFEDLPEGGDVTDWIERIGDAPEVAA